MRPKPESERDEPRWRGSCAGGFFWAHAPFMRYSLVIARPGSQFPASVSAA